MTRPLSNTPKKQETKTRKGGLPRQPMTETTMTAKDATIQGGARGVP